MFNGIVLFLTNVFLQCSLYFTENMLFKLGSFFFFSLSAAYKCLFDAAAGTDFKQLYNNLQRNGG